MIAGMEQFTLSFTRVLVSGGKDDVARYLAEAGADIEAENNAGQTALYVSKHFRSSDSFVDTMQLRKTD